MKKIISVLLIAILLLSALAGCGKKPDGGHVMTDPITGEPVIDPITGEPVVIDPTTGEPVVTPQTGLPSGMSGTDAAKLILANERLNSQLFKNGDSIFVSGPAVFEKLAAIADENMKKITYSDSYVVDDIALSSGLGKNTTELSIVPVASVKHEGSDGSYVEVNGDTYKWSNFQEYSNSYDYFTNITNNVKTTAEIGAELIDNTKKYVRIVDKWVSVGGAEYYLHVEDDMEVIYSRHGDHVDLCRRTKREDGVNVYEIYQQGGGSGDMRMVYIPGEKYEYSYIFDDFDHNFLAENTKGFWEVVDVGASGESYNVSCMVIKDDICYNAFYDPLMKTVGTIKVISSDKKTDIVYVTNGVSALQMDLQLQGFNGVDHVRITVPSEYVKPNTYEGSGAQIYYYTEKDSKTVYQTNGAKSCEVVLKNGKVLKEGDEFLDGKVRVGRSIAQHSNKEGGSDGYGATLELIIRGSTYEEKMDIFNEFLKLTGLECRRDTAIVEAGILQAFKEAEQMAKYHKWCDSPINSVETIDKGYANNLAMHKSYSDMYEAIKNAEVIDFSDKEAVALNVHFAPISAQTATSVKQNALTVSVTDLELTVEDTLLFVEGEAYKVNFAILGTGDNAGMGLTHIELGETPTVTYAEGDLFKVKQTASFELPALAEGEYTVVTYISTADGIRSSGYTKLIFTEAAAYETKLGDVSMSVDKNSAGELAISLVEIKDILVEISAPESGTHTYATMHEALCNEAYVYGFIADGAKVEKLGEGDAWAALRGDETDVESGTYRLKYNIKNGSSVAEGYVYVHYNSGKGTPA